MQLVVSVTNKCNLDCRHCLVDKEIPNSLSLNDISRVASTFDVSRVAMLGGEPFMRKDLDRICDMFSQPITIYTNGVHLAKHPERLVENVHYAVSLDGWQEFHNYLRNAKIFDLTTETIEMLAEKQREERIKSAWIRMTISRDNLGDVRKVCNYADKLGVRVMLFPLLDTRPPMSTKTQLNLFEFACENDHVSMYSPPFWQFVGYDQSTCQAGKYRLHVTQTGHVTPCQWMPERILGHIYTHDYDELVEKGQQFHKEYVNVHNQCYGCQRACSCKGGCRLNPDYMGCPLRRGLRAENTLDVDLAEHVVGVKHSTTFGGDDIVGC